MEEMELVEAVVEEEHILWSKVNLELVVMVETDMLK
jgi:hypothetical protein